MKAEQLRKSILQLAIQGKLVPQNPNDEPASVLLERIRAEKQQLIKEGKIKKDKVDSVIFKGDDNRHYEKVGNEIKDITDDLPFEIPDSWVFVRLSTVCWLGDIAKSTGERLPYLDAKTLRGKADKTYLVDGKIVDVGKKVILVDGENSGEVFDIPFRGYMGSTFKTLETVSHFNFGYLNVVLDYYRDTFRGNKIGAAIPHLNKNLFKSLLVGIPPIPEQARIVAEIEKYEPLIAEYDKFEQHATRLDNEIYDKLKKSILQYAIQGKLVPQDPNDEPASELLKRIRAEKKAQLGKKYVDSYIYKGDDNCYYEHIDGKDKDEAIEVPFDLPDDWAWCKLTNIIKSITDGTHSTPKYTQNGIPFVSVKDISSGELKLNDTKYISIKEHKELSKRCNPQRGDILLTKVGTTGIPVLINVDIEFSLFVSVALIKFNHNYILPDYFIYLLKSPLVQMQAVENTRGVGNKNWVLSDIEKTILAIPPLAEQQRIVNKINEIFAKL